MPNDPYLDASVRWKIKTGQALLNEPRYRDVAAAIEDSGIATELVRLIGSGKEADVYLARDDTALIAIKVYRTYRTANRVGREMKLDSIGHLASWEFDLLVYAYRDGARVPRPIRREEHMFSMQYLGTWESPAPRLREVTEGSMDQIARKTIDAVEHLVGSGVVHTDLSPYNILVDRGEPWIIDVGKCLRVDRLGSPPWVTLHRARTAIEAGARNLARFFGSRGVPIDEEETARRFFRQIERYDLLAE